VDKHINLLTRTVPSHYLALFDPGASQFPLKMERKNKNRLSISLPLTCSEGRRSRRLQRRSPPELGYALSS
jgi:hypothetical protein